MFSDLHICALYVSSQAPQDWQLSLSVAIFFFFFFFMLFALLLQEQEVSGCVGPSLQQADHGGRLRALLHRLGRRVHQ